MVKTEHASRGILFWILLFVVVFQIAFCGWYAYRSFYAELNSDSASDILHAQLIAQEGHFLFSDNWYNSTELRVLYWQMFMVPLFKLGMGYRLVNAISLTAMVALLAFVAYRTMRMIKCSRDMSMLGAVLFVFPDMCFSYFTLIYPAYTIISILGLLAAGVSLQYFYEPFTRKIALVSCMIGFLLGVTGKKLFVMMSIPMTVFPVLGWLRKNSRRDCARALLTEAVKERKGVLCMLAGSLAGLAVNIFLLEARFGGCLYPSVIASDAEINSKLLGIPMALYSFFGTGVLERNMLLSTLAKGGALGLMLVLYGANIVLWKRDGNEKTKRLAGYILFSLIYMFIILLNYGSGDEYIYRYFVMGMFPLLFALPCALDKVSRRSVICMLSVAICLFTFGVRTYQAQSNARRLPVEDHGRSDAVKYLCENGYQYGAATFWNANVNTVRTDGQLRFMPVIYPDGQLQFWPWLTQKDYAEKQPEFYLLSRAEWNALTGVGVVVPGMVVYEDDGFIVTDTRALNGE